MNASELRRNTSAVLLKCIIQVALAVVVGSECGFAQDGTPDLSSVPGVVIYHSPASTQIYVGSPGIVPVSENEYLAKCDEFGPRSTEKSTGVTRVFRSP